MWPFCSASVPYGYTVSKRTSLWAYNLSRRSPSYTNSKRSSEWACSTPQRSPGYTIS